MLTVEHLPPKEKMIGILSSLAGYGSLQQKDAVQIIDIGMTSFLNYFKKEIFTDYMRKRRFDLSFFEGRQAQGRPI